MALLKPMQKGEWSLLSLKELPLKEAKEILSILEKKSILTTLLSQRQVMVRTLQLELKKESDVYKALHFQVEPHLPFPLEEAILQTQVEKKKERGFTVTLFALKTSSLKEHLDNVALHDISPDGVTCPAIALAALLLLEKKEVNNEAKFLINIGEQETNVILATRGKVIDQRSFLTENNGGLAIQRALLSLESIHPQYNNSLLFLFGKNSHLQVKSLQEATGKKIHLINPQIENISHEELATFALAIGAALSQGMNQAMNFRQKTFKKNYIYKFIKRPLALALTLTLFSISMLIGAGNYYLKTKEHYTQQKMASLLEFSGKKEISLQEFKGIDSYEQALSLVEKRIVNEEQGYPLEPIIPQVSEVLSWLSEEISNAQPPLKGLVIEEFHYELVSRPTPLLKNERYQVHLEVHFSATSPNVKEAFEELLQEASIVNQREEISVSFFGGRGKAQFTLKDKTRYG